MCTNGEKPNDDEWMAPAASVSKAQLALMDENKPVWTAETVIPSDPDVIEAGGSVGRRNKKNKKRAAGHRFH
jgi:hypothetical protein